MTQRCLSPELWGFRRFRLHHKINLRETTVNKIWSNQTKRVGFQLARGVVGVFSLGIACLSLPAFAQIVPDSTLGNESSQVTPNVNVGGSLGDRIDGGAVRGSSLFHSFSEFNVNNGQRVYFADPAGIENIFSRVTGSNISNILGTLGVEGAANLFLLNPNGILFGQNARLDIQGSFVASTGDRFIFPDGMEFGASNPQAPPLLTMSVPVGVQYGAQSGTITNAGNLEVGSGQTLALQGSDVTSTGSLSAPGGTVMILGDRIGLFDNAQINVSSQTGGGTVLIGGGLQGNGTVPNAARTFVDAGVQIEADALVTGDGGSVIIWADEVTGFYGNISARGGIEAGNGGFVEVSGKENLIFRGNVDTSASQGNPGTLLLDPENITIVNGNGSADNSQLDDSQILQGDGGASSFTISQTKLEELSGDTNVILQATNNITINDLDDDKLTFETGTGKIAFTADSDGNGVGSFLMQDVKDTIYTNGRDITISGASLTLGNINTFSSVESPETKKVVVNVDKGGSIDDATFDYDTFTTIPKETKFYFNVSEQDSIISDLNVRFSAEHTWVSDLSVSLQSPEGTQLNLFSRVGGDGDNFQDTLLDDEATTSIDQGTAPFKGSFRPDESLATFDGQKPNGQWTLTVTDNAFRDSGTLFKADETAHWGIATGTQLVFELGSTQPSISSGKSGSIELNATNGNISVGKLDTANNFGAGGNITLNATGNITIANNTTADGLSSHSSSSNGGNIALTAGGSINLTNSSIYSNSRNGKSGNVTIEARSTDLSQPAIQLINTGIDAAAFSSDGKTGNVTINATNGGSVKLVGMSQPPSIYTDTFGEGGNLTISGGSVTIDNYQLIADVNSGASGNGGQVSINTPDHGNVSITNNAVISTITRDQGNAGNLTINTGRLILSDSAQISTSSLGEGTGGDIKIDASESVELQGSTANLQNDVLIPALTGKGSLRSLLNNPNANANVVALLAGSESNGEAGSITIETQKLTAQNGALISTTVFGEGQGGDIMIDASEKVELTNSSLISATLNAGQKGGTSGDILINTPEFILNDGATVSSTTTSTGQGGNIHIKDASSVELRNDGNNTTLPTSLLTSSIIGSGRSGNIEIDTQRLIIQDRSALLSTSGSSLLRNQLGEQKSKQGGLAGNISINATDSVELFGQKESESFTSSISSATFTPNPAGNITINSPTLSLQGRTQISVEAISGSDAGDINITAGQFSIQDRAQVTVSSPEGQAGNLSITANTLSLDEGQITAETGKRSEQGGANINLQLTDLLLLRNQSLISANANGDANGGNITINAPFVIAVPWENSDIIANAFTGNGGEINITANRVLGLQQQNGQTFDTLRQNRTSDISVSSQFGIQGTVTIQSLNIDPSQGLGELPIDVVDPSNQIATGCGATGGTTANRQSEFVVTGRGGLPPKPDDLQTPGTLSPEWVTRDLGNVNRTDIPNQPLAADSTDALVEAQGMFINAKGELILTAQSSQTNPSQSGLSTKFCSPVSDRH